LTAKSFVEGCGYTDQNGYDTDALKVTDTGWNWIEANESRFVLRKPTKAELAEISDADIPF
jgi:hypothetical protein